MPVLTDSDWRRLHSRVLPNPLTVQEFRRIAMDGKLHDHFRATDIRRILTEFRDVLQEHGQLRHAQNVSPSGRKADMSSTVAIICRALENPAPPPLRPPPPANPQPQPQHQPQRTSDEPIIPGPGDSLIPARSPGRRNGSGALINEHMDDLLAPLASGRTSPGPAAAAPAATVADARARLPTPYSKLIAQNAASPPPPEQPSDTPGSSPPVPIDSSGGGTSSSGGYPTPGDGSPAAPLPRLSAEDREAASFNAHASPFLNILSVFHRFSLLYGTRAVSFRLPVAHMAAVNRRQAHVLVIPFQHPSLPACWPRVKDISVTVNGTRVPATWKRLWPERKVPVNKTFLPLDITALLSRTNVSQTLRVDVHAVEYQCPAVLVVAEVFPIAEVLARTLHAALGARTAAAIEAQLRRIPPGGPPPPPGGADADGPEAAVRRRIAESDAAARRFYAAVLAAETDADVEAEDPVVSVKCPISQVPLHIPVRGAHCPHPQCVDLESFLVSSNRGCFWNCPLCDQPMGAADVRVDTVLWRHLLAHPECLQPGHGHHHHHHLRLTARGDGGAPGWEAPPDPESRGGTTAAAAAAARDVIDISDEEEEGEEAPGQPAEAADGLSLPWEESLEPPVKRERFESATPPPLVAEPIPPEFCFDHCDDLGGGAAADGGGGGVPAWPAEAPHDQEEEARPSMQGTADDPIEL